MRISEFIHFGETCHRFILSSSADKNTFAEQLCIDSQRMFQILHERSLISHMNPHMRNIWAIMPLWYKVWRLSYRMPWKKQTRNQLHCQKFISSPFCVACFPRDKWKTVKTKWRLLSYNSYSRSHLLFLTHFPSCKPLFSCFLPVNEMCIIQSY